MYILFNQPFLTTLCPFPLLLSYFTFSAPTPPPPQPFFPTRIKTNSTQFHEILPDNLAEGMRNKGFAAGDHAESQKQSTGHNHSPRSHDDEFVSCSRQHCKKGFTACVFIDYHKKGSHLMSTGWSCGRLTKAISVTLHAILHASKPTILSRVSGHSEQQQQKDLCVCVCIFSKETNLFKLPSKCFRRT